MLTRKVNSPLRLPPSPFCACLTSVLCRRPRGSSTTKRVLLEVPAVGMRGLEVLATIKTSLLVPANSVRRCLRSRPQLKKHIKLLKGRGGKWVSGLVSDLGTIWMCVLLCCVVFFFSSSQKSHFVGQPRRDSFGHFEGSQNLGGFGRTFPRREKESVAGLFLSS